MNRQTHRKLVGKGSLHEVRAVFQRIFRRSTVDKSPEALDLPEQQKSFIESIAQTIVEQVAPEEIPVFAELTAMYFADPTPPDLTTTPQYDPLSIGLGELLVAVTPAATAVVVYALTTLSKKRPLSAAEWQQRFDYKVGLQELLNRISPRHPRYNELLTFQARLTDNMQQARQYGDTDTLRADRFQIIAQLNPLALDTVGESFNALCGMAGGIEPAKWQELREHGLHIAQTFGMTEEMAEDISDAMLTAFLTAVWSDKDA